ncbi:hypothetical protein CRG98_046126 [Punica granatum]|uniref:Uncharacterized protein n=1 Tax=Punica granatum TaxID=22663 RepID=A0A2I0HP16_PUNGR|nr:hypothetical protein CRG98_046126 [Punica granatum]
MSLLISYAMKFLNKALNAPHGLLDLLLSFNTFVLDEYKIEVGDHDNLQQAMINPRLKSIFNLIHRVNKQLKGNPSIYESFIQVITTCPHATMEAYTKVCTLLKDLVHEFVSFFLDPWSRECRSSGLGR